MSNPFDDIRAAVQNAKSTLRAADETASVMASLLVGRLRKVGSSSWDREDLKKLKKELQAFNSTTGKWREEP